MSETLDIYNDSMIPLGTMSREEVHRVGAWHKTFHCWITRQDNSGGYVIFQRRSSEKKSHPNKLDITAAGHLVAGETPEDGLREVAEEIGMKDVKYDDLHFLGVRVAASMSSIETNREFNHVYLLHDDRPLSEYTLQRDEVAALVQIAIPDGLDLCAGRKASVPAVGFQLDKDGKPESITIEVALSDIIARKDHYYLKIFIMSQRLLNGNSDICI